LGTLLTFGSESSSGRSSKNRLEVVGLNLCHTVYPSSGRILRVPNLLTQLRSASSAPIFINNYGRWWVKLNFSNIHLFSVGYKRTNFYFSDFATDPSRLMFALKLDFFSKTVKFLKTTAVILSVSVRFMET
jgi:hypothetical protein